MKELEMNFKEANVALIKEAGKLDKQGYTIAAISKKLNIPLGMTRRYIMLYRLSNTSMH